MARKTKAELAAEAAVEQAQRVEVARSTYTERMMAVLARAVKESFELTVKDNQFLVADRNDRRASPFFVYAEWTVVSDMALYELQMAVEFKEEERTEAERRYTMKQAALSKLSTEERELLGL